jgi:formylglycine-generating enzyme required for sulfatase activity
MSLTYRCQLQNRLITLTQELANSGEAKVWHTNFNGYLAKIYHNPHNERVDKLQLMVRNRPSDPNAHLNHISFAWPYSILEDNRGEIVGFLMPEVVGSETLLKLCTPKLRRQDKLEANWYFLHVVARNIAAIIQAIHAKGYVLGDIKLENILVNNRALPTIIDTDSFQVSDPYSGKIYRCLVGSEGFTPAELIGVNIADVDQTEVHDRFRLGVVIYYLLFSGPPFRGLWQGAGDSLEQSELIRRGLWPFSGDKLVVPSNTTIPLNILHRDLHALFLRCFNEGHKFPDRRPTAEEWRGTLEAALKEVIRCGKIDNHYYNRSYGKCYWCERSSDLNFDIFPGKSIANVTSTPSPKVAPTPLTNFTENLPNGITLEMVGLPAGQFLMGSPDSDPDAASWEKPQHQVQVNSFAIGKYPVTQAQYEAVMGTNPSWFKNNPQNPVEDVSCSWDDAQAFCQKLSQITGKTYRLPTEAEWEYACRAGTTTRYYFGDDANQLGDYAWYDGNSQRTTHFVGQKKPNAWGLYDMNGNVWEWCEDYWHDSYKNAPSDGSAWLTKNDDNYHISHIIRGGSWGLDPGYCRSASRARSGGGFLAVSLGFRVVCVPNVTSTQLPIANVTSTPSPKVAPTPLTNFTENLPNGITLEMVGLPAGQFLMGSPDSDRDAESYEKPQHQVKINSFAIGKYPVTQAQYQAVMGTNPSHFSNNPQNPVERISWDDAQAFCQKLSQITGKTYRLPTEAEWEYACRGGTTTRFYFGDDANQLEDYAWYDGNSGGKTHPVGQKKPNAWGLYDMSGNVWEWCEDNSHNNYIGAPKDGSAWLTNDNDYHILRGGSWYDFPNYCRSAYDFTYFRRDYYYYVGFRVVCVPNVTSTQLPIATVTSTPLPKVAPPAPSSPPPPPAKLTPFTENLPNGLTLEMVGLPAGQFLMGSPDSDRDAESWEKPQHQVKINSFAIGKYPVTQAQYQAVMGTNPSHFSNNPQNPVERISWDDAQAFCQKLSQITGKTYRLPTEAEWEYACRGGTTTRFYFGDDASQLADYAWYDGNSQGKTHFVGQKKPNAWGLYDMNGNVWEWCEDNWHDSYKNAPSDGSAWLTNDNDYKLLRGGSWYDRPAYCRSASRVFYLRRDIIDFNYVIGFRVVCVPPLIS